MDPLTHGLLGAATAQLGFRQRLGGGATWAAAAAAMLADVDIFFGPLLKAMGKNLDDLPTWVTHRGLTHSLIAPPVIALVVLIVWRIAARLRRQDPPSPAPATPAGNALHPEVQAQRQAALEQARQERSRPPGTLLSLLCLLLAAYTHPLLDACTTYGTMLLAPFHDTRYAYNAIGIVDIIFTPLLLLTVMFSCVMRDEQPRARAAVAAVGLLLAAGYIGAGLLAHGWVVDKVRQQAGDEFVRAEAYPSPGSIFLWRAVVQTKTKWQVQRVHLLAARPDPAAATRPAPKTVYASRPQEIVILRRNALVDRAAELPQVKRFYEKANGVVGATLEKDGANQVVTFHDLRYGMRVGVIDSLWSYIVVMDAKGKILSEGQVRHDRGSLIDMAVNCWNEMITP